ncbi:YjbH domain-containing protein [Paraburkholderia sp. Ac-20336]|uniref:YjbH domain-containing protein n=1 Tax=unclassified Paraburkholderia TaxID=2615204 RepID=UPI0014216947|nr:MULTISPECIES: YjbH domain-containing protein [unclassified Paraburkholderia]MBN3804566.1 YjbH domain-containing protein [Paraburkholderia sp. Ac-20336]NIF80947.1 YjbH domain-containing protein [Paraburkholderia sp. Cy-641]
MRSMNRFGCTRGFRLAPHALAWAVFLSFASTARAVEPALNALGQSGGLTIPYAFTLPVGTAEAQFNNYIDPRYGRQATSSQVYWGAFGILPYVEVSGGLANYPFVGPAEFSQGDHTVIRHLVANAKVEIPKFFKYQPSIAFGTTDIGGRTHYFRSTYGVVSQTFGPVALTAGYGHGDRLDGLFGGLQLSLWSTGVSLLAEDDSKTPYVGVRYQSPRISWLGDANLIATAMRSLRSTNSVAPRTSISLAVQIPLGKRFDSDRCAGGLCKERSASADTAVSDTAMPDSAPDTVAGPVYLSSYSHDKAPAALPITYVSPLQENTRLVLADTSVTGSPRPALSPIGVTDTASLDAITAQLFAAGLERVRVGISGRDLVVEYENHRYNQNEADALGIVLGVASSEAPSRIEKIRAVIKKANQAIGEVSVDRRAFAKFIEGGAPTAASASMTMRTQPTYDTDSISWQGDEHKHGLSRIQIEPVTSYLYGTEYGNFDISLGANIEGFVPLWKGAELYASYIAPLYNTKNMDDGRVFSQYRLRGGLSAVALGQSFWLSPQIFNVAAVGKFDFHYVGLENETTLFVPGRPDLVRLRLAYLHEEPGSQAFPAEKNAMLTYRWVKPEWNLWVEAGVARYVAGDKGPLITFTRWFDDVSVSVHAEHSGMGSFVGATVTFPLTPRQGMKPGLTQVYGSEQFALDFQTRVGSKNYLSPDAVQNMSFPYSTQQYLLNQGRFSGEYFSTQLYRMRDAYLRYASPDAKAGIQGAGGNMQRSSLKPASLSESFGNDALKVGDMSISSPVSDQ